MSKINNISLLGHVEDVDGILAGIDQASYHDAIRNSCAIFFAGDKALSGSLDNVYLFTRPEYVLSMAISEGKSPNHALDEWHEAVGHMMAKYRKSRRKSVLFEVASAMDYSHMEFPLKAETIELALATLAVCQSGEIKCLLDELTASSIPLDGWGRPPRVDLNAITEQYRQFRVQLHQVQEELESIHLERKQQAEALGQHQAELKIVTELKESLSRENICLKDELDQVKKRLVEFESQQVEIDSESKELREENELLILQLHQVQEELEQYYLKLQAASFKEVKSDTQKADAEPEASSPALPAKPKNRSKFIRKIAALKRLRSEAALLKSSSLFDGAWYLQRYPDVAAAKVNPVHHYLRFGAAEGRNPGPDFNTELYLLKYPDVAESGLNPLVHYLKYGKHEGRMKSDWNWN